MAFKVSETTEELWDTGYAMFPIDDLPAGIIEKLNLEHLVNKPGIIDRIAEMSGVRSGENKFDPDVGLIERNGNNHDKKYFYHHDVLLPERVRSGDIYMPDDEIEFIKSGSILREYINNIGKLITQELDKEYGLKVAKAYAKACNYSSPYSTNILRQLYYRWSLDQTGASLHIDRSFITIHLGDEGGKLIAYIDQAGEEKIISPPPGWAVVFFGVKVLWVTGGLKQPLWHRSDVVSGQPRLANVHFGHVEIPGYYVEDSEVAVKDFNETYLPLIKAGKYHWQYV